MSRLRVLIVDHTGDLGGAELALCRLLPALKDAADVSVLLFSDGPLAGLLRDAGTPVDIVPLHTALLGTTRWGAGRSPARAAVNAVRALPHVLRVARAIRRAAPDLVHSTSLKADLVAVPAALLARTPLVWHIHDRISDDYLPRPMVALLRFLARFAPRAVIVNSQATAATLPGVRHLVVAYPGFSPDQVGLPPSRRPWPNPPVVGILGRISPTKGQLEFVRAAAQVLPHHPDTTFHIIGAPLFGHDDYAALLRNEVQNLGLGHRVEFSGHTDDPATALDGLSLLVHASPTPEPFGQVIVEAMIRGVPVIATDAGGASEIVRSGSGEMAFGLLVEPGRVDDLAGAIAKVLDDPAAALAVATEAWESACRRFPVQETGDVVAAVWQDVIRSPRHHRL